MAGQGSEVDGPLIVKTELNHGGRPEADNRDASRWKRRIRRMLRHTSLRYRFAPRARCRAVWSNPSLVVERFMPEREGAAYAIRWCLFLGDRATSFRLVPDNPVVRSSSAPP